MNASIGQLYWNTGKWGVFPGGPGPGHDHHRLGTGLLDAFYSGHGVAMVDAGPPED